MSVLATILLFAAPLFALPSGPTTLTMFLEERSPDFEWTAWGDSYASGVGAGKYIDGRRCLRYQNAYPEIISDDPDKLLSGKGGKFNNVVCSGAKAEEVEEYQFYDKDQYYGQPNWQFYPRPATGKPTMGTLTVGGDDIDFPGILNNCIVEGFPFPLNQGFVTRTCDEQRDLSWGLICEKGDHNKPNLDLVKKFDSVIKKIVKYGQGVNQKNFRLYVTGYGQFFNDQDHGCDTVTFARTANPKDDNKPHTKLTTTLRADFNAMSRTLNAAIKQAVDQNKNDNVVFIDIDGMLNGHRFCEKGVKEPDQNNLNLWFFHYPYKENDGDNDAGIKYLNSVAAANVNSLGWDPKKTLYVDFVNNFWNKVDEKQLNQTVGGDAQAAANFWSDTIGSRAKLFHPQLNFHHEIYKAIINQYKKDTAPAPQTTTTQPKPTPTPTPTPVQAPGGNCPQPYPGYQHADQFPDWIKNNVCKTVCPGGKYDFCAIVDSNKHPTTGYCQCTDKKCTDSGNYECYQPA